MILTERSHAEAATIWREAIIPQRSMAFYNYTSLGPFIVIAAALMLTSIRGTGLAIISICCGLICFVGFCRLAYETTLEIAGFKEYLLPIWSVFYLIFYEIAVFAFLFFGMHTAAPGHFFGKFSQDTELAFLDSYYLSLCNYIVHYPNVKYTFKTYGTNMLMGIQSLLSSILTLLLVTEFISAFHQ